MTHSKTRPPAPKERPVALAVGGASPRAARFSPAPPFEAPRAASTAGTGRGDAIGLAVFTLLIVLGLLAAGRAFLVM